MTAGPLRNRHGGLEVPKEVSRNGVILPPIGGALASPMSLVAGGSEAGRTGLTGRYQHNGTTKKKKKSSSTPVAAVAGAQNIQGAICEAEGNSPGVTSTTSNGGTTIAVCGAVADAPSTSLHGDDGHRDSANVIGATTTAGGNGQQEYLSSSDEDRSRGATGHGKSPAAGAKDDANNGLDEMVEEVKGEMETKTDHVPGGIVVETSGGAHSDPHTSGRAKTTNIGEEKGRRGPNSPVTTMRARVDDALRNLLTLGSESQASPTTTSDSANPSRTATGRSKTPGQPGTRGLSPLSWSRLKPGRRTQEQEPVFIGSSQDKDLGSGDGNSNQKPGLNANEGSVAKGSVPNTTCLKVIAPSIDGGMSTRDRHENVQPGVAEPTASSGLKIGIAVGSGERQKIVSETDKVSHHGGSVGHNKVETGAGGMVVEKSVTVAEAEKSRRVLTRDNTLVHRDVWPELLDNEADPHEWSLDKGEDEVLATARGMGSILVRAVTWNLHAKPTPAADKLREALLPPGKFHIYAIGTEECLHSIAKSMIVHSKKEWESLLKETLGDSYEMLCAHGLQATHNAVFAHRGIIPLLNNVRSSAVATGLSLGAPGTTLGNKGGVGISFNVGTTSCVFVNSHLAAHQNNVRERNDHFFLISHGLVRELGPPNLRAASKCGGGGEEDGLRSTDELAPAVTPTPSSDSEQPPPGTIEDDGHTIPTDGGTTDRDDHSPTDSPPNAVMGTKEQVHGEDQHRTTERPPSPRVARVEEGMDQDSTNPAKDNGAPSPVVRSPSKTTAATPTPSVSLSSTKESMGERSHNAGREVAVAPPPVDLAGVSDTSKPNIAMVHDVTSPRNMPPSHHQNGENVSNPPGQGGRARERVRVTEEESERRRNCSSTLPQVFDRVVWAGDLNYRINAPRAVADLLLSKDMHEVLLKNEQLSLERSKHGGEGGAGSLGEGRGESLVPFSGYSEGPLNFRPTYKFDSGTDTYDTSTKQRVPAWTDRILYSGAASRVVGCNEGKEGQDKGGRETDDVQAVTAGMELRAYRSVEELKTSDHRPVLASFVMEFDQREGIGNDGSGGDEAAVTNQTSSEVCSVM